jgi:hypothetical protein
MKTIKLYSEKLEITFNESDKITICTKEDVIVKINDNKLFKNGSLSIEEKEHINISFEETIKLKVGKIYKKGEMLIKLTWADRFDASGFFQRFHFYGFNTDTGYFKSCFDVMHDNYHGFEEATKEEWEEKMIEKCSKMTSKDIYYLLENLISKETQKVD